MKFSITTAIDEASGLETWAAAYEHIMRALGFDEDDPAYLADAMADTAVDEGIVANWNKANPAQRQWMVTQIVSAEVTYSYDRRTVTAQGIVERLKHFVRRQKGQ
ncbi:MAG: hypothetical protein WCL10_07740 [Novosphingobium sp.]|uniref:hypothetical protein n=1 Tax=Novosphingobium sp. TaxID=1874826 RepID=UPI003015F659